MRADVQGEEDEDVDVPVVGDSIPVWILRDDAAEKDDSADYSSCQTYEVLGAGAAGGPSSAVQILPRADKRLQAVISIYDASGNGAGVYLCDKKQGNSGQTGVGAFVASGQTITYKGKDELWVLPAAVKSNAGDVYVGVIDQRYK